MDRISIFVLFASNPTPFVLLDGRNIKLETYLHSAWCDSSPTKQEFEYSGQP